MPSSRRQFLSTTVAGVAGLAAAAKAQAPSAAPAAPGAPPDAGTPGAPPTTLVGSGAAGPAVDAAAFAAAEKLVQAACTPAQRELEAQNWRESMAPVYERRTGPKQLALEDALAPGSLWSPLLGGAVTSHAPKRARFVRSRGEAGALPRSDEDLAFATVVQLSRWVKSRQLGSERLTRIYLDRLERHDPQLKCVITLAKDEALAAARQADRELAAGKYRGPLHGIPYGVKDLLDTRGVRTTWGAEPYQDRVPTEDAALVKRLRDAGAVLVAKLSLGALALNDVWFGGQTKNPWLPVEGSSGSSAGPGSATAAGLVGFSIGSETLGSIVSPSMRCGVTGLRPTFGRVARTGAMTLCWSLDKLGPMARGVEDTLLVLDAISGADPGDPYSVPSKLDFDANAGARGLRVGYVPRFMKDATDVERHALEVAKQAGLVPVEVDLPDWPYGSLVLTLFAEAAASFEEPTLAGRLDALRMQVADAWPNTFRQSRFLSAVDYVQADRLRRKVALAMAKIMGEVDLLLVPSFSDMLTIANYTGHPSLTLRAGFVEVTQTRTDWAPDPKNPFPPVKLDRPARVPHGVTLVGRLFDEGTLGRAGLALERAFGVAHERPAGF